MNKSQLLIELPSMLSHIVTKRGRVLRDGGSSGVSTLLRAKNTAWLTTSVRSKGQPWDDAHDVAAKISKEFGASIYVEPVGLHGRFRELTSPTPVSSPESDIGFKNPLLASRAGGHAGVGATPGAGFDGMFGGNFDSMAISGVTSSRSSSGFGIPGIPSITDPLSSLMPHIPSPLDFLPKEVASMLDAPAKASLAFTALRSAEGFSELPEATAEMFEVEAAQVMTSAQSVGVQIVDDYSALVVLALQTNISKALSRFLERATAGSKSAPHQEASLQAASS